MARAENAIQRDIIRFLRGRGAYVLNVGGSSSTAKGTPDVLGCHRGIFFGFEVKKPVDSYGTTKPQETRIRQIRAAGGIAEVVVSVDDVVRIIREIEEGHRG